MSVTMKDVATYTGISIGTVSNYVTGKAPVSEAKQKIIQEAIDTLGYQVNMAGRNLRKKSFDTIGILIPSLKNKYLLRVSSVVEELLRKKGYGVMVSSYHGDPDKEKKIFVEMARRVDGMIYVPGQSSPKWIKTVEKIQQDLPVIIFDEDLSERCCDCVLVDSQSAARKTAGALLDAGYRDIGMILGPENRYTTKQRYEGYVAAFRERGIQMDPNLVIYGDYSKGMGAQLCDQLLARNPDISAILVVAYRMTLGVLSTLNSQRIRNRVTVIGYDAEDLDGVVVPPVGYVYQPFNQIAEKVVELIMKRISGDMTGFPERVFLEAELRGLSALKK